MRGLLIFELREVELLVVLGKKLSEEVAVGEILFEVDDRFRQIDFIVQPRENQITHIACGFSIYQDFFISINTIEIL